jgi:hypothetical protein
VGLQKRAERQIKRTEGGIADPQGRETGIIDQWRDDPELFVREAIGVNEKTRRGLVISDQQKEGLRELGKLTRAKYKLWLSENRPELNVVRTEEEIEYAKKDGISIMSGKGTGKDAFGAWAIIWFMSCFPFPKLPCTATSASQLESVLWSEVSKWLHLQDEDGNYVCIVRDDFDLQAKRMYYNKLPKKQRGKEWFAEARSVNKHDSQEAQAQCLAGRHTDYMMYVVDEASAVPDPVFTIFEGGLTQKCNIILMIFNPTQRSGFAYKSHFGTEEAKTPWIRLHWDSEKSPLVSRTQVQKMEDKYGRESNTFRVQVRGLPPTVDDDTLIPDDWVYSAIEKHEDMIPSKSDPVIMGVDPALGGGAEAVITVRKGPKQTDQWIYPIIADHKELGAHVVNKANDVEADAIFIDTIGIGSSVYTYVQDFYSRSKTHSVDVRRSSSDESKYARLRDEIWWNMRERFRAGTISILDDEILRGQLNSIKIMSPDAKGRTRIEDKRDYTRRAGGGNLDRADALMLTFRMNDEFLRTSKEQDDEDAYEREPMGVGVHDEFGWMGS